MIQIPQARLIIWEHLCRPIKGKVLTLGRQTIGMTYDQTLDLLKREGYTPSQEVMEKADEELDQSTRGGSKSGNFITDKTFFGLLGVDDLSSMDVSTYEKASIIHNFNLPIAESFHGQFDYIIDGGTFDHLFDVRTALENIVKMLKPGGRVMQWNAASNFTGQVYLSFTPEFFYDYFTVNQFADCRVYLVELDQDQKELWDFYQLESSAKSTAWSPSSRMQMALVLAEKGPSSTWDKMPVQAKYRDAELWEPYKKGGSQIDESKMKFGLSESKNFAPASVSEDTRSHGLKWFLLKLKGSFPETLKKWTPLKVKKIMYILLEHEPVKSVQGYRYVGRI